MSEDVVADIIDGGTALGGIAGGVVGAAAAIGAGVGVADGIGVVAGGAVLGGIVGCGAAVAAVAGGIVIGGIVIAAHDCIEWLLDKIEEYRENKEYERLKKEAMERFKVEELEKLKLKIDGEMAQLKDEIKKLFGELRKEIDDEVAEQIDLLRYQLMNKRKGIMLIYPDIFNQKFIDE